MLQICLAQIKKNIYNKLVQVKSYTDDSTDFARKNICNTGDQTIFPSGIYLPYTSG